MGLKLKKKDKKVAINITLDQNLLEFVEDLAKQSSSNISATINDIVEYIKGEYEKGQVEVNGGAK